jgi:hypothetical protein
LPIRHDISGGYIVISYSDGIRNHFVRLHVAPYSINTPYAYSTPRGLQELHPQETAVNFMTQFMKFFLPSWSTSSYTLFFNNGNDTFLNLGTFGFTPIVGNSTLTPISPADQNTWSFRASDSARVKFAHLSAENVSYIRVTDPNYSAKVTAITGYMLNSTNMIVSVTNKFTSAFISLTYTFNRRLRRRYGLQ